jgi:hypothetical protein
MGQGLNHVMSVRLLALQPLTCWRSGLDFLLSEQRASEIGSETTGDLNSSDDAGLSWA